jgi:phosphoribosylglycinamide formyltransferase-1
LTLKLGILVSGAGTNLQAILDAVESGRLDAKVQVVVSNRPGVAALARASKAGVPALSLDHRAYANREAFDDAVVEQFRKHDVRFVVLAGFMRLLTGRLLSAFPDRVINIHPALLPAFPGTRAEEQALHYGVKVTGCTVHFVDAGVDTGPILGQRAVAVQDDDDVASLHARISEQEHELLVDSLVLIAADRVCIEPAAEGRRRRRVVVRAA